MLFDVIVDEFVSALSGAGVEAVKQYPNARLDRSHGPVVCVGIKSVKRSSVGLGEYLGVGEYGGSSCELYGNKLEADVSMEIFVPWNAQEGADVCMDCFGDISAAAESLPDGIKVRSIDMSAPAPDKQTGMLRGCATARCSAYFICTQDEESGEFTDFVLKGSFE